MNALILTTLLAATIVSGITTDLLPTDGIIVLYLPFWQLDSFIRFGTPYAATNYGTLTYLEMEDTPVRENNSRYIISSKSF